MDNLRKQADMDNRTPTERFWSKVDRLGPDDCWHYQAATQQGYGIFSLNGKNVKAHRFSWQEEHGDIPAGLVLDHNCHNLDETCPGGECAHRSCVNPNHLRAVPHGENLISSRHTLNHAAATATHCPSGHEYTPSNTAQTKAGRQCIQCRLNNSARHEPRRAAAKRERYALLRAAGVPWREAQSASKVKVAMVDGISGDLSPLA